MAKVCSTLERAECAILPSLCALLFYDFNLRASHARTLLPAALASVPFGFVLVRVRVRVRVVLTGVQAFWVQDNNT